MSNNLSLINGIPRNNHLTISPHDSKLHQLAGIALSNQFHRHTNNLAAGSADRRFLGRINTSKNKGDIEYASTNKLHSLLLKQPNEKEGFANPFIINNQQVYGQNYIRDVNGIYPSSVLSEPKTSSSQKLIKYEEGLRHPNYSNNKSLPQAIYTSLSAGNIQQRHIYESIVKRMKIVNYQCSSSNHMMGAGNLINTDVLGNTAGIKQIPGLCLPNDSANYYITHNNSPLGIRPPLLKLRGLNNSESDFKIQCTKFKMTPSTKLDDQQHQQQQLPEPKDDQKEMKVDQTQQIQTQTHNSNQDRMLQEIMYHMILNNHGLSLPDLMSVKNNMALTANHVTADCSESMIDKGAIIKETSVIMTNPNFYDDKIPRYANYNCNNNSCYTSTLSTKKTVSYQNVQSPTKVVKRRGPKRKLTGNIPTNDLNSQSRDAYSATPSSSCLHSSSDTSIQSKQTTKKRSAVVVPKFSKGHFLPEDMTSLHSTIVEGHAIACFDVGGEKRLCLPQVLNIVLKQFPLTQINKACDALHIYCSRCTDVQLKALKSSGIISFVVPDCGLITKTDTERLCDHLLRVCSKTAVVPHEISDFNDNNTTTPSIYDFNDCEYDQRARSSKPHQPIRSPANNAIPKICLPDVTGFTIYHECFGRCYGTVYPKLYDRPRAPCIECLECRLLLSPTQFVCHSHRPACKRTCHWGFDSERWRSYVFPVYKNLTKSLYEDIHLFSPLNFAVEAAADQDGDLKSNSSHTESTDEQFKKSIDTEFEAFTALFIETDKANKIENINNPRDKDINYEATISAPYSNQLPNNAVNADQVKHVIESTKFKNSYLLNNDPIIKCNISSLITTTKTPTAIASQNEIATQVDTFKLETNFQQDLKPLIKHEIPDVEAEYKDLTSTLCHDYMNQKFINSVAAFATNVRSNQLPANNFTYPPFHPNMYLKDQMALHPYFMPSTNLYYDNIPNIFHTLIPPPNIMANLPFAKPATFGPFYPYCSHIMNYPADASSDSSSMPKPEFTGSQQLFDSLPLDKPDNPCVEVEDNTSLGIGLPEIQNPITTVGINTNSGCNSDCINNSRPNLIPPITSKSYSLDSLHHRKRQAIEDYSLKSRNKIESISQLIPLSSHHVGDLEQETAHKSAQISTPKSEKIINNASGIVDSKHYGTAVQVDANDFPKDIVTPKDMSNLNNRLSNLLNELRAQVKANVTTAFESVDYISPSSNNPTNNVNRVKLNGLMDRIDGLFGHAASTVRSNVVEIFKERTTQAQHRLKQYFEENSRDLAMKSKHQTVSSIFSKAEPSFSSSSSTRSNQTLYSSGSKNISTNSFLTSSGSTLSSLSSGPISPCGTIS